MIDSYFPTSPVEQHLYHAFRDFYHREDSKTDKNIIKNNDNVHKQKTIIKNSNKRQPPSSDLEQTECGVVKHVSGQQTPN